jgi:formate-dependent nitrite reductase membrane component NrfD
LLPNREQAHIAFVFLGLCSLLSLVMALIRVYQLNRLSSNPPQEVARSDEVATVVALVRLALWVVTGIVFCAWFYRAHRNATRLGAEGMVYSAVWTWAGFLIPIANLVVPLHVAREVWQASDLEVPLGRKFDPQNSTVAPVIGWWWVLSIFSGVLYGFGAGLLVATLVAPTPVANSAQLSLVFFVVAEFCGLASGLLAIRMVQRLQARQEERCRRLNAVAEAPQQ